MWETVDISEEQSLLYYFLFYYTLYSESMAMFILISVVSRYLSICQCVFGDS